MTHHRLRTPLEDGPAVLRQRERHPHLGAERLEPCPFARRGAGQLLFPEGVLELGVPARVVEGDRGVAGELHDDPLVALGEGARLRMAE